MADTDKHSWSGLSELSSLNCFNAHNPTEIERIWQAVERDFHFQPFLIMRVVGFRSYTHALNPVYVLLEHHVHLWEESSTEQFTLLDLCFKMLAFNNNVFVNETPYLQ